MAGDLINAYFVRVRPFSVLSIAFWPRHFHQMLIVLPVTVLWLEISSVGKRIFLLLVELIDSFSSNSDRFRFSLYPADNVINCTSLVC